VATSIGHSLAGCVALAATRRQRSFPVLVAVIVLANAPDLDFLPGLIVGMPALYHHGITHSLGAATIAAVAGALALCRLGVPFGAGLRIAFIAYGSHLALDLVGPDIRPPSGIPLFWPLSDALFLSPVTLLPGVHHAVRADAATADWLRGILVGRNVAAIAIETFLFAPIAWLAVRRLPVIHTAER
jgi:membrane-bound metal-dependent hydrolase YbcI (DUF457 family)